MFATQLPLLPSLSNSAREQSLCWGSEFNFSVTILLAILIISWFLFLRISKCLGQKIRSVISLYWQTAWSHLFLSIAGQSLFPNFFRSAWRVSDEDCMRMTRHCDSDKSLAGCCHFPCSARLCIEKLLNYRQTHYIHSSSKHPSKALLSCPCGCSCNDVTLSTFCWRMDGWAQPLASSSYPTHNLSRTIAFHRFHQFFFASFRTDKNVKSFFPYMTLFSNSL